MFLTDYYQKKDEHELEKIFKGHLRNYGEPKTESIFKKAKPYVDSSFEGEAILSVGKTIDFAKTGCERNCQYYAFYLHAWNDRQYPAQTISRGKQQHSHPEYGL